MTSKSRLLVKELVLLSLLAALMVGTQVAMAAIPNVHLVAVFVVLAALLFGWKSLYSIVVFVVAEALIYGINIWVINYFYVWPLLAVAAILFRNNRSRLFWAMVTGIHGLLFGALCSIPYFLTGGWAAGVAYWVSGIPFDLIHCVSNVVMSFVLLMPLYNLCQKLLN